MASPSEKDRFSRLPVEILWIIQEKGDISMRELASLSATSRRLNQVFEGRLYRQGHMQETEPNNKRFPIMLWGACVGRVGTMRKMEDAGGSLHGVLPSLGGRPSRQNRFLNISAEPGGQLIHYAAGLGNREAVEFLLDKGASIDAQCGIGLEDQYSYQYGHVAHERKAPMFPFQVARKLDYWFSWYAEWKRWCRYWKAWGGIEQPGPVRATPLYLALCRRETATAELIILRGASLKVLFEDISRGEWNQFTNTTTAIHLAAASGQHSLIPIMARRAVRRQDGRLVLDGVNQICSFGTPLHLAAACAAGNVETVRELVKCGACVDGNGVPWEGMPRNFPRNDITPLCLAVRAGRWDIARTLLALGAKFDVGSPTYSPRTGDSKLIRTGSIIVLALIGRPGSGPPKDSEGQEAFIRQIITERGLNPNNYFPSFLGQLRTPLQHCLQERPVPRIASVLVELGATPHV